VIFAGGRGFVTYQDLDGASAQTIAQWVVEALAFYRKDPAILRVEWKTRGHQPDSVSRPTIGMFAGGGMGLMYPRLSVMTLALSTKDTEGFNSSAMSISVSLGGALALAATGIVFAAFTTTTASFAGVFALTAVIGVAAVAVAPRVAVRRQQQRQN
jgi:hypothetical protein